MHSVLPQYVQYSRSLSPIAHGTVTRLGPHLVAVVKQKCTQTRVWSDLPVNLRQRIVELQVFPASS